MLKQHLSKLWNAACGGLGVFWLTKDFTQKNGVSPMPAQQTPMIQIACQALTTAIWAAAPMMSHDLFDAAMRDEIEGLLQLIRPDRCGEKHTETLGVDNLSAEDQKHFFELALNRSLQLVRQGAAENKCAKKVMPLGLAACLPANLPQRSFTIATYLKPKKNKPDKYEAHVASVIGQGTCTCENCLPRLLASALMGTMQLAQALNTQYSAEGGEFMTAFTGHMQDIAKQNPSLGAVVIDTKDIPPADTKHKNN